MFTFVLGGGGVRGAYQVGALQALLEADLRPQMLVGTSVGALNASYLAIHGVSLDTVADLSMVWCEAEESGLLARGGPWPATRALLGLSRNRMYAEMRDFCIRHGMSPQLTFSDIEGVKLFVIATDLAYERPLVFGQSSYHSVLDAVLASAAIPPFVSPIQQADHLLTDGGIVSNLPIEPAIAQGATEIIALSVANLPPEQLEDINATSVLKQVMATTSRRQYELELAVASARQVPVQVIQLQGEVYMPTFGPCIAPQLIAEGYALARYAIGTRSVSKRPWWRSWWDRVRGASV